MRSNSATEHPQHGAYLYQVVAMYVVSFYEGVGNASEHILPCCCAVLVGSCHRRCLREGRSMTP